MPRSQRNLCQVDTPLIREIPNNLENPCIIKYENIPSQIRR